MSNVCEPLFSILFDGHKCTRFITITMAQDLSYEENVLPNNVDVYSILYFGCSFHCVLNAN